MAEMDDAIGAYLSELKEENERLIQIIDKRQDNATSRKWLLRTFQHQSRTTGREKASFNQDSELSYNVAMKSYQSATFLA